MRWFKHRKQGDAGEQKLRFNRPKEYVKYLWQYPGYDEFLERAGGYKYWVETWYGSPFLLVRTLMFHVEKWQPTTGEWIYAPWVGEDIFRMYGQTYRQISEEQASAYQQQPELLSDTAEENLAFLWQYYIEGGDQDIQR